MEPNETEIVTTPETDTEPTENGEETVESLKKMITTLEAQKDHWRKKAETNKDEKKPEVKPESTTPSSSLSEKDVYALVSAGVPLEDVDEVKAFAAYKKVPVSEIIKDKTLQNILAERKEERRSAEVANTKTTRTNSKVSSEDLLNGARLGKLPDKDEDIASLVSARMAAKLGKK